MDIIVWVCYNIRKYLRKGECDMADTTYEYKEYEAMRINLYILEKLYRECLKAKGKKLKGSKIEFAELIGVNARHLNRIVREENKSMLSNAEVKFITKVFNISEDYFKVGSDKIFNIGGLKTGHWKEYMWGTQGILFEYSDMIEEKTLKELEERIDKGIETAIKSVDDRYRSEEAVYRICYRFLKNATYVDSSILIIKNCVEDLESVSVREIDSCDIDELDNYVMRLEKRVEEFKAMQIVRRVIRREGKKTE